jgi:hypothetical protein
MIILYIQMLDFVVDHVKRDPPVTADRNTPGPGPVARKLVRTPPRRASYLAHVLRHDQYGDNFPYSIDQIPPNTSGIVILDETPEASVAHATDMHIYTVRYNRTWIKPFFK